MNIFLVIETYQTYISETYKIIIVLNTRTIDIRIMVLQYSLEHKKIHGSEQI